MSGIESLIEDENIQVTYKKEIGKNARWGGNLTQVFKDWVKENKERFQELKEESSGVKLKPKGLKIAKAEPRIKPKETVKKLLKEAEPKEEDLLEGDSFDDTLDGEAEEVLTMEKEMLGEGIKIKPKISLKKEPKVETKIEPKKEIKSKEKKSVVLSGVSRKKHKPTIFTSKFEDTWQVLIAKGREDKKKGIKRKKGIIIILSGDTGSGKTHLAVDMVNVPEIELTYRIIPRGKPIYLIMTDPAPLDEVDRNYKKHKWIDIFPVNCYVEDESTGLIDPSATLEKINSFLSSLKSREDGTVVIEDWTIYCALVLYSYMKRSGGKGGKGIKFDDFLRPEKSLTPTEYQYKARLIDQILLSFQNKYMLNFVLVANLKDDWTKGKTVYDSERTGTQSEDMQKGSDRKADVVVRMWKEEVGEQIIRKLIFKKSRFEGDVVITNEQIINSPTAYELIKTIVKLYLKGKV